MIKLDKNISSYFDEDFINIIYKDLKSNNYNFDEDIFRAKNREFINNKVHIFSLHNYKLGSIGYTTRELKETGKNFLTVKYLSNDYNGPSPSYLVAFVKIIFEANSGKILGFQIANERNIEKRLDCIKSLMDNDMGIKELAKVRVYSDNDINPDILNIAALMAINKEAKIVNVNEIEVENIENLVKHKSFLLDVREDYEFEAGHIKGAVNIPLRSLVNQLDSIPKDKNVYVYCRTGHRSLDAVGFLNDLGIKNAFNVAGGFIELSLNEFKKDKGELSSSILTNYNFE
ncbi:MAG: rhodanese-like domain-containing protein [Fusobacterium sp.]|uniref:rhodanese-like domain-containing protein n=1 Tax=Fusobacterium sp. TaxID=68766 RepID=UPI0026DB8ED2|nr:rhodanese-like domain-containing protein [Fusobacterium sp.]MDO4689957.1 rhodanese-like domain-containing protein [Fusobacterium sp.]